MRARAALPVQLMSRSCPSGVSLGGGGGAVYLGFPDGIVAVTSAEVPSMPNGIVVAPSELPSMQPGLVASLVPGRIEVGRSTIAWDTADPYDLKLGKGRRSWTGLPQIAPGSDPFLADAREEIATALVRGDSARVAQTALRILGRGRGLTPEGDDVVAGAAATARAVGVADEVIASILPLDAHSRTTSLSATLLRLAVQGRVIEPMLRVLSEDGGSLEVAARELSRVGSSTGTCYLRAATAVIDAYRAHIAEGVQPSVS